LPKLVFDSRRGPSIAAVTAIVNRLEPRARVTVTPLGERVDEWLAELSMAPLAASALGLFGLGLATVGMFGVFAYVVRQRTREIGIRIALGATRGQVMRLVLTGSSRAVIAGLAAGTLGAIGASQVLREWLYGLSPLDPLTYGGVAVLLAASAMAASYVPARRAARLDPAQALRE
jgi:ABC-type antimicrobial peptide transport system permease subunit